MARCVATTNGESSGQRRLVPNKKKKNPAWRHYIIRPALLFALGNLHVKRGPGRVQFMIFFFLPFPPLPLSLSPFTYHPARKDEKFTATTTRRVYLSRENPTIPLFPDFLSSPAFYFFFFSLFDRVHASERESSSKPITSSSTLVSQALSTK